MRLIFNIDDNSNHKIDKADIEPRGDVSYTTEKYAIYFEGHSTADTLNKLVKLCIQKQIAYYCKKVTFGEYEY